MLKKVIKMSMLIGLIPILGFSQTPKTPAATEGYVYRTLTNYVASGILYNVIPTSSNTVDLGSPEKPFRDLHLGSDSIYMSGQKVLSYTNGSLVVSSGSTTNSDSVVSYSALTNLVNGMSITNTWISGPDSVTNTQVFINGLLRSWSTNNIPLQ